jgi:hemoglobin
METIPTLYEWAGGKDIFETLTKVFYEKVLKDELLYPVFKDMSPQHPPACRTFYWRFLEGQNLIQKMIKGVIQ